MKKLTKQVLSVLTPKLMNISFSSLEDLYK